MVLHEFPDLHWLRNQAEKRFADRRGWEGRTLRNSGWPNVVLNVKTSNILRDNIRGPLSIFANLSGESIVETGKRNVRVRDGFFYVTNHDQHYSLAVGAEKASTFNIHFGEYFCDQVFSSLNASPHALLDDASFTPPFERINFHNKLHVKTEGFNHLATQIIDSANDNLLLEQNLFSLMTMLLEDEVNLRRSHDDLHAIRVSTREEIIKRLLLSTDYIYSFYDRDLSLDDLAEVSCMSRFHFLRLFKLVFRKTPHQFIMDVRLEKAKVLLGNPKINVNSISRVLGFKDASSFSRMFYRKVGVYPSEFRQQ
jgi:AraC family transcriptional regulator